MYSDTDLDEAVSDGALTADDIARFRAWIARRQAQPLVDEEHFRLVTGFNDIFVSIAGVLLLVAIGWIGSALPSDGAVTLPSPFAGALVAAASWGLAEFFTRKRRMALPSILFLLAFAGGVFFTAGAAAAMLIGDPSGPRAAALIAAFAGAVTAGAAWLHWRRFRVPITVAAGIGALAALAIALATAAVPDSRQLLNIMMIVTGVSVFAFAMWWDMSDTARRTRRADVAFWLHLLAAPLIVHPTFALLGLLDNGASVGEAVAVLLLYVALGFVAVAIDRRALLVSALAYVLYALNLLFREFGAVSLNVALTALVIGSALLLLSAFWSTAREAVARTLPAAWRLRLPPTGFSPRPA